ncbi:hypothetical protein PLICRDRAFT_174075 [Plicaturopsis crispa FD-325 SS-3]|nr:hypothetical protein PLICRDRAFT_174075 [Plicaturopsis crispa FD-325 SS-3]
MASSTLFFLLLCIPSLGFALDTPPVAPLPLSSLRRRGGKSVPAQGYFTPSDGGGSMLTTVPDTFPAGLHEPVNAIITANSDAAVLVDQTTDGGLRNYFTSFGFSSECLGQHTGSDQQVDLGDGNGSKNETAVIRWDYGDPSVGTCKETIEGGNHFRYWVQNGKSADSGAVFLAVSYEKPIAQQHDIIPNGYNAARDWLVGNATFQTYIIPTETLTNASTYSGSTSYNGYTYSTSVQYVSGLLPNTSDGINHFQSVPINGSNAVDGLVAVMTVKITARPAGSNAASPTSHPRTWLLSTLIASAAILCASAITCL